MRSSVKSLTFPKFMILMVILLINSNDKMGINSLIKSMVQEPEIFIFWYIDQDCRSSYWKYVLSLSIFLFSIPNKILCLIFQTKFIIKSNKFSEFPNYNKKVRKLRFRLKALQFHIHNGSKSNFRRPRSVSLPGIILIKSGNFSHFKAS